MIPTHYDQLISPIQYMQVALTPEEFKGFLKGNIIKYIARAEQKGGAADYYKAHVYANWLSEFTTNGEITFNEE